MKSGWLLEIPESATTGAAAIFERHGITPAPDDDTLSFFDLRDGPFTLDITTEAFDFIETHRSAFLDFRTTYPTARIDLFFYETLPENGCGFILEPSMSGVLYELGIRLEIEIQK